MVTTSIIKHLLSDDDSLSSYFKGKQVSFDDVKRRMLLLERMGNRFIADHYYRLSQEKSFDDIDSIATVLCKGLFRIAEDHLEFRRNRIHVKQDKQNDWQELITRIPPLVLQAAFLHKYKPLTDKKTNAVQDYFRDIILPNARYTALPHPYIPQLENYIEGKNGLHDLHMHLNGSTETDIAWQDFLFTPDKIYKELKDGFKNNLVKEQFEQESHLTDPLKFRDLLLIARRIRNFMFVILYPESLSQEDLNRVNKIKTKEEESCPNESIEKLANIESIDKLLETLINVDTPFFDGIHNPFSDLVANTEITDAYPMAVECLMYILLFQHLSGKPKGCIESLFHFYLLILGLSNRLLVQQMHQNGFEQFQKQTVNYLRTHPEKVYKNRFLQLHGNELRNINFLEGRFSPDLTRRGNQKLLHDILSGWDSLKKEINNRVMIEKQSSKREPYSNDRCKEIDSDKLSRIKHLLFDTTVSDTPTLKLVAHFIKKKEKEYEKDAMIRHKQLRKEVWQKATILSLMKMNGDPYIKEVIGVDAAASEFDAPPEVFAPSFRMLRRRGFEHFTYHAGEDFFHILSGLRAIYESIDFFGMQHGDRIGHAVASGVDAQVWIDNVGRHILIRQGEHLDNLLFAYHLIMQEEVMALKPYLPFVAHKISELSFKIYGEFYSVDLQLSAWQLRKYCPMLLFAGTDEFAEPYNVFCEKEFTDIQKEIPNMATDKRVELLAKYHSEHIRKEYDRIIDIDVLDPFDKNAIKTLQLVLLKYMHKKEIVIETLPTSNVRIGHHHDYNTYHLWNWVKWEEEGASIPPIVVGTDDTGIFATNIYNEYANIYCHLTCQCEMNHEKAMALIERLDKNAGVYKFE